VASSFNNISGLATSPGAGFEDGEAAIISQNIGNKDFNRALDAFKKTLMVSLVVGIIAFILTGIFMDRLFVIFSRGDIEFAKEIKSIFQYERYGIITLAATSASLGFLYGLQKFTKLGGRGIGLAMMYSNVLVGILSIGNLENEKGKTYK